MLFDRSDRPVEVNKRRENEESIRFSTRSKVTSALTAGEDDKESPAVRSDHVRFADED